jgi:hypothetical protein
VKRARAFDARGDLLAQFFGVASEALRLLAEALQFSESQFIRGRHNFSLDRVHIAVTDKRNPISRES